MKSSDKNALAVVAALVLTAGGVGGAFVLSASGDAPDVGPLDAVSLGPTVTAVEDFSGLQRVPGVEEAQLASVATELDGGTPASEVYVLATYRNARAVVMRAPERPNRVCFAATGYRVVATCLDQKYLNNGRTVLSVPLVARLVDPALATPRVDFFIVPDDVARVGTVDGAAVPVNNVATIERPRGGEMGTVTYYLTDGRNVRVAFAPSSP